MGRIRTVKPDLLRHEALFEAEKASGLPLRLAFIGLFTVADREGRFFWAPRKLKLDVLPYDEDVDFAAVMDALASAGFVRRYEVGGKSFGCIPSFLRHQRPNIRETPSMIPPDPQFETVPEVAAPPPCTCAHMHETALHVQESAGKGREYKEGKGKEYSELFDRFWTAYPRHQPSRFKAFQSFERLHPDAETLNQMVAWISAAKMSDQWRDPALIPYATTFLNNRYWQGDQPPSKNSIKAVDLVGMSGSTGSDMLEDPQYLAEIQQLEAVRQGKELESLKAEHKKRGRGRIN